MLHSDNRSIFIAKDFAFFCERWSVKLSFTPIVRPHANQVERSHRTLTSSLQKAATTEDDWDSILPEIVLAHNSVPNRTQIPPLYALYGRHSSVSQLFLEPEGNMDPREEEEKYARNIGLLL